MLTSHPLSEKTQYIRRWNSPVVCIDDLKSPFKAAQESQRKSHENRSYILRSLCLLKVIESNSFAKSPGGYYSITYITYSLLPLLLLCYQIGMTHEIVKLWSWWLTNLLTEIMIQRISGTIQFAWKIDRIWNQLLFICFSDTTLNIFFSSLPSSNLTQRKKFWSFNFVFFFLSSWNLVKSLNLNYDN